MQFAYEDLSSEQFERLVVLLCQELLGMGVQGFSTGPDGGRDARFEGTASHFPSDTKPWVGKTIIQAKHTNGINRSFTESDFYTASSKSTTIAREIPRIQALRTNGDLDNYILFANRRLTGDGESAIRNHLSKTCNIPTEALYLCGVEQLELWLKRYKEIPELASLDPLDSPLIVSPEDLAEIVQAFALRADEIASVIDDPPTVRVNLETKNRLNGMTEEYSKAQRRKFLKDTEQIRQFLAAPENYDLLQMYESTVDEFELKIITHRKDYQTFDQVMDYLVDLLFSRDPVLRQREHKRLTRAMLFYMYWNCDIGRREEDSDASADKTLAS